MLLVDRVEPRYFPLLVRKRVLDSHICSDPVELLVDGRLGTRGPPGQIIARAAPPDLRGALWWENRVIPPLRM